MKNTPFGPIYENVLEGIANTPLVHIQNIDTGPCDLFIKLEGQNPGGSIKDRIGIAMIEAAEKEGKLTPGATIVEATAGNTGLSLALVAAQRGYPCIIVVPDKMSQEKIFHLKALGADVRLTRSDVGKGHPEYYQDMAEKIAAETGGFYVNQFENKNNVQAHYDSTAPEIWGQMGEDMDALITGVGSGGTITGHARFFADNAPGVEVILADPVGSIMTEYVTTGQIPNEVGSWLVEGIGEDFVPDICDVSHVKTAFQISDAESFAAARELLQKEGILGGSSSGTLFAAALKYCRAQTEKKRVVTFACDRGEKYLSKMYNDYWMIDQGFIKRDQRGDLTDLISRRHEDRATVVCKPDDTLMQAYGRMKMYDISQLPVLDDQDKVVGMLDEEDILLSVVQDKDKFKSPVHAAMCNRVETISADATINELVPIFDKGYVAIVVKDDRFEGLVTKADLLNHLRLQLD